MEHFPTPQERAEAERAWRRLLQWAARRAREAREAPARPTPSPQPEGQADG
jgi:hypothetical protein